MNQQPGSLLGVIARGGGGMTSAGLTIVDPASLTWATDFFRSSGATATAILFVPQLEQTPRIGQGTQLDELLPDHSPQLAVVSLPTHVTGIVAAIRDSAPCLGNRAEFIAAVRHHVQSSYAGAWLKRVAKLDSPTPSLLQHIRSWLPLTHGQFVTLHPQSAVGRRPAAPPQPGPPFVLRTSAEPQSFVRAALGAAYSPARQEVLPAGHRLGVRWGTDRVVEYVATPDPVSLQLPPPQGQCPTCGDPVWGQCAFCHLTPPRLDRWSGVSVPGVSPLHEQPPTPEPPVAQVAPLVESTPKHVPPEQAAPAPRAFQLPRHRQNAQRPPQG